MRNFNFFPIAKKYFTAVIYGPISALAYILICKVYTPDPLLASSIWLFVAVSISLPFSTISRIKKEFVGYNIFRPIIFVASQLLILLALRTGTVYSIFVSAAAGTVASLLLGRLYLREVILPVQLWGTGLCFFGLMFLQDQIQSPLSALIAGVLQGIGVFLARKRSLGGGEPIDMTVSSLIALFIGVILVNSIIPRRFDFELLNYKYLIIAAPTVVILQLSYNYLSQQYAAWQLSLIGNMRIPASVFIGFIFLSTPISIQKVIVGLVICIGISMTFITKRKSYYV